MIKKLAAQPPAKKRRKKSLVFGRMATLDNFKFNPTTAIGLSSYSSTKVIILVLGHCTTIIKNCKAIVVALEHMPSDHKVVGWNPPGKIF